MGVTPRTVRSDRVRTTGRKSGSAPPRSYTASPTYIRLP